MNFIDCQYIGYLDEQDVRNNYYTDSSVIEKFFLAVKITDSNYTYSGIIIIKEYGYYSVGFRDYGWYHDSPAGFQLNYMTKPNFLYYLENVFNSVDDFLFMLTTEQKEDLITAIENDTDFESRKT